ncbi:asparagine synthase (glutamine-hydrolyzing) [Rugamonas sp. FT82W]|uniref:asparagine synthase (glutamine-hydrolyzing) n=1 Tax=Duganella vulcania TaxID=2692166 RepID=A0A845GD07_9BURK|nr:asparagine synthase (glutamine-hydrolyzing) [Duganella vulcania]MYM91450.1 asparagine synthase (glutamine-hydrolyzing) [Duganella vulcania]
MCGITGIYSADRSRPAQSAACAAMAAALRHRGPDEGGDFAAPGVAMGFTRLSIIDLATGNQPHSNATGEIVSIVNGEIYNHRELRAGLESRGHRFRTHCDVEVVVHLYEEYGLDFAKRLNGQFAFALYDAREHRLVLGRDQTGIAPLFHTRVGDALLFGSEIKALLAHPGVGRRLNLRALDQILTFPGMRSPATMFEGVDALPPGHLLIADAAGTRLRQYWDLVYPADPAPAPANADDHVERLDTLLRDAVERRLAADVPVGLYLSGGLDSSLIGALARQAAPDQVLHSFSITFPDAAIDERAAQRRMAEALGTVHHEIEFSADEIANRLRDAVLAAEAPLKESYNTCSLALSQLVRDSGHKVVLTGEGADELFGGYVGYRLDAAGEQRGVAEGLEAMLEDELRGELWGDPGFFYERDYALFRETKAGIYSADVAARLAEFDATREPAVDHARMAGRHRLHQRSYADFKLRLADHLLADHGDRVAYAHSVEARYPFLDAELVDFMTQVPPGLLVRDGTEKWLLRQVALRHLPPELARREKFGFVAPGAAHLLQRRIPWVEELLSPETIRRQNIFNADLVQRLRARQLDGGARPNTTFDTDLLMLVLTCGLFLDAFGLG